MLISIHNTKDGPTINPEFDCKILDDDGNSLTNITSVTIHLSANGKNRLVINGAEMTALISWDISLDDIEAAVKVTAVAPRRRVTE